MTKGLGGYIVAKQQMLRIVVNFENWAKIHKKDKVTEDISEEYTS